LGKKGIGRNRERLKTGLNNFIFFNYKISEENNDTTSNYNQIKERKGKEIKVFIL